MTLQHNVSLRTWRAISLLLAAAALLIVGQAFAQEMAVKLSGDAQNPPVKTAASGSGSFKVGADQALSGTVTTTGVSGTMAHIHSGATGENGPVVIPLTKGGADGQWTVPAGTKLTEAQLELLKSGKLYVNVHSASNPGGEIRAQLK